MFLAVIVGCSVLPEPGHTLSYIHAITELEYTVQQTLLLPRPHSCSKACFFHSHFPWTFASLNPWLQRTKHQDSDSALTAKNPEGSGSLAMAEGSWARRHIILYPKASGTRLEAITCTSVTQKPFVPRGTWKKGLWRHIAILFLGSSDKEYLINLVSDN